MNIRSSNDTVMEESLVYNKSAICRPEERFSSVELNDVENLLYDRSIDIKILKTLDNIYVRNTI